MASKYWIKLYHEVLDDPKMGRLTDRLFRRTIQCFLLAGEVDRGGLLPPLDDISWRLRPIPIEELETDFADLAGMGILHKTKDGWIVTNFARRQAPIPDAERMRRYRERKRLQDYYEGVTRPDTKRNIDKIRGDKEEDDTLPPLPPIPETIFDAEQQPYIKLYQKITGIFPGNGQYEEIIQAIHYIRHAKKVGTENLEQYLAPFFLAWRSRRTTGGVNYNKKNTAWLIDWALNGEIPPRSKGKAQQEIPEGYTPA